tara:strand:+ start:641 stop:964 length:324 start_codon:yes stop_codon:yes gene_type:complete
MARDAEWAIAESAGIYQGADEDRADGFIHFSTATQVCESAAQHRAGEAGLILVACDPDALGADLKWEPARGGDLFPHLYGNIPMSAVAWARPLPLDADGQHLFPETL